MCFIAGAKAEAEAAATGLGCVGGRASYFTRAETARAQEDVNNLRSRTAMLQLVSVPTLNSTLLQVFSFAVLDIIPGA